MTGTCRPGEPRCIGIFATCICTVLVNIQHKRPFLHNLMHGQYRGPNRLTNSRNTVALSCRSCDPLIWLAACLNATCTSIFAGRLERQSALRISQQGMRSQAPQHWQLSWEILAKLSCYSLQRGRCTLCMHIGQASGWTWDTGCVKLALYWLST